MYSCFIIVQECFWNSSGEQFLYFCFSLFVQGEQFLYFCFSLFVQVEQFLYLCILPFWIKQNEYVQENRIRGPARSGATRTLYIPIIIYNKQFQSIYAVIIKVFQTIFIVCASLRSAPALGKDNIVFLFHNCLGMFLEQFGRIVVVFLYSPFLNKKKQETFRKKRTNHTTKIDVCILVSIIVQECF